MEAGRPCSSIIFLLLTVYLLFPAISAVEVNYCDRKHAYPVKVDGVKISPDPVESGKPATFTISASTDKALLGGKLVVEVSLLGLRIHSESHDLCKETSCPVDAGKFTLSHSQNLPPFTPPGSYTVKMIMKNESNVQLTCISFKLRIVFGSEVTSDASEEALVSDELTLSDS